MSELPDRMIWALWRRKQLERRLPGFWASVWSYADSDCGFTQGNRIYRNAYLRGSSLGRMSYVAQASRVGFATVGAFTSIGPHCTIGGLGWHPTDRLSTHPAFYSDRGQAGESFCPDDAAQGLSVELPTTELGSDVWIGANSIVLDGNAVGHGAVIAAGAVVTRPVPPYAIVGGVPAKLIRYRFAPTVIQHLLAWRWWELPNEALRRLAPEFRHSRAWREEDVQALQARSGEGRA